jgi:class 3 adenylate cyclase
MNKHSSGLLGQKVAGVRIVPLALKIILIFILLLLISNFASNFINLMLNRGELLDLMNQLLVKDLKELHVFCNNQYEIYEFNQDMEATVTNMKKSAMNNFTRDKSNAFGVRPDGSIFFFASRTVDMERFQDEEALEKMKTPVQGRREGSLLYNHNGEEYFGVYKYNTQWDMYLVRSEELQEFYRESWNIFKNISIIIVIITILCVGIGIFLLRYILRYVNHITNSIMQMQERQSIDLIDMSKAPNDDVTYLGMSFNALAHTINNLMTIFRKFVAKDIAQKAYKEREVRLEGAPRELTILFSDIKGFTNMTETLGTGIINLLNMHYEQAISRIREHEGVMGSIIGDAILAVFGTLDTQHENKSLQALDAGYEIQEVAAALREEMTARKEEIIKQRGSLTEEEEQVYHAVMIEVGVGLDGGEVFYGNIGSTKRMTSTVIGDNVNSASRLEGLTRIYKVPVICSEYIKNEIEEHSDRFLFLELDQVQVKGKTIGKKVYWPIEKKRVDEDFKKDIDLFKNGLESYYAGDWKSAHGSFKQCGLAVAEVFRERTKDQKSPQGWNGIWTMKTK